MLQSFSGATVRRVVDRSGSRVPEHAHDWPVLSIFVLGGYLNQTEIGEAFIAGPSAVFYQGGAAHRNTIAASGFEQIEVEFDPAWLGRALPSVPISRWIGGRVGAEARTLARVCSGGAGETRIRAALQQFVETASRETEQLPASWLEAIAGRLGQDASLKVSDLAREVGRHPSWLGTAYRRAVGEGLAETAARFRVERAARLLRETDMPAASVAAEAGFCDQSHMSRTFRRVLGRLPSAVRDDRRGFRLGPAVETPAAAVR